MKAIIIASVEYKLKLYVSSVPVSHDDLAAMSQYEVVCALGGYL